MKIERCLKSEKPPRQENMLNQSIIYTYKTKHLKE